MNPLWGISDDFVEGQLRSHSTLCPRGTSCEHLPSLGNLTRLCDGSTSKSFDVGAPGVNPVTLQPSVGDLTRLFWWVNFEVVRRLCPRRTSCGHLPSLGDLTRLFGGSTSKSFDVCAPGGPPVTLEPSLGDLRRVFWRVNFEVIRRLCPRKACCDT